jgi:glycolate oxidase
VPGSLERAEEFGGAILRLCVQVGGSITGEHGVGIDKKPYMPAMFTPDDLDTMQLVRCAFDPRRLANPTKVFPTPRLCAERGGPYRPHPLEQAGVLERF